MIQKYKEKSKIIEAVQFTGDNFQELKNFCPYLQYEYINEKLFVSVYSKIDIKTLNIDDYIFTEKDRFYKTSKEKFESRFEKI